MDHLSTQCLVDAWNTVRSQQQWGVGCPTSGCPAGTPRVQALDLKKCWKSTCNDASDADVTAVAAELSLAYTSCTELHAAGACQQLSVKRSCPVSCGSCHNDDSCSNYINEGGGRMFSTLGGNRLFVRSGDTYADGQSRWLDEPAGGLDYTTSGCGDALKPTGDGDILYSTCNTSTLFAGVFSSESRSIAGFRVEGVLGSKGRGVTEGNLEPLKSGRLHGFYRTSHSACTWDGGCMSSVNHLIITTTPGALHSWDTSNRFDHDDVAFTAAKLGGDQIHLHDGRFYMLGKVESTEECKDHGDEIKTAAECREAALALGLLRPDEAIVEQEVNTEPPGCYEGATHTAVTSAQGGDFGGRHHVRFNKQPPGPLYYSTPNGPCAQYAKCICAHHTRPAPGATTALGRRCSCTT